MTIIQFYNVYDCTSFLFSFLVRHHLVTVKNDSVCIKNRNEVIALLNALKKCQKNVRDYYGKPIKTKKIKSKHSESQLSLF